VAGGIRRTRTSSSPVQRWSPARWREAGVLRPGGLAEQTAMREVAMVAAVRSMSPDDLFDAVTDQVGRVSTRMWLWHVGATMYRRIVVRSRVANSSTPSPSSGTAVPRPIRLSGRDRHASYFEFLNCALTCYARWRTCGRLPVPFIRRSSLRAAWYPQFGRRPAAVANQHRYVSEVWTAAAHRRYRQYGWSGCHVAWSP
jgi:hypothetical protein